VVDEPTEHLDRTTADALMDDVIALTAGKALLVVTHDTALIARCDRVVALAPGPVGHASAEGAPLLAPRDAPVTAGR